MKYVVLYPCNPNRTFSSLVVQRSRSPVKRFQINIYKFYFLVFFYNPFYGISVSTCTLISLNVRSIGNFKKRKMIFTWFRKQKADFIFLQETHASIKKDSKTCQKNEWGSEVIMAHGSSNSCGVAILVKKGVDCTQFWTPLDGMSY